MVYRKDRIKNKVRIIINKSVNDDIVDITRVEDRIILIRLVLGEECINTNSAYAFQVGLDGTIKQFFLKGHRWNNSREKFYKIAIRLVMLYGIKC